MLLMRTSHNFLIQEETDLILAHEGPSDTRDSKIVALRLIFNAFKALEGEKCKEPILAMRLSLDFNKKFYNSLGSAPNRLSGDALTPSQNPRRRHFESHDAIALYWRRRLHALYAWFFKIIGVKLITWVAWEKVLSSKKNGGLDVSSLFALNRALLFKWIWRFLSQDGSLWYHVICAIHGVRLEQHSRNSNSTWGAIIREAHLLASKGFDFLSHCKIRVGDGSYTRFWLDTWILDSPLYVRSPRLFALESVEDISVASNGVLLLSMRLSEDGLGMALRVISGPSFALC
nr:RNA-directed DNA polymerase, eukaryota, reverse transcriptase zinc-binding domain protein [Tanacetum cinerariifolium]